MTNNIVYATVVCLFAYVCVCIYIYIYIYMYIYVYNIYIYIYIYMSSFYIISYYSMLQYTIVEVEVMIVVQVDSSPDGNAPPFWEKSDNGKSQTTNLGVLGFQGQGFRVQDLGFYIEVLGFQGQGFRVLGFYGLGFRVLGAQFALVVAGTRGGGTITIINIITVTIICILILTRKTDVINISIMFTITTRHIMMRISVMISMIVIHQYNKYYDYLHYRWRARGGYWFTFVVS